MKQEIKQIILQENETTNALVRGWEDLVRERLKNVLVVLSKEGINELSFDYENGDAPSCIFCSDSDYCDTYIKHIVWNEYGFLTKIDVYLYYVGEHIDDVRQSDLMNFELDLYNQLCTYIKSL